MEIVAPVIILALKKKNGAIIIMKSLYVWIKFMIAYSILRMFQVALFIPLMRYYFRSNYVILVTNAKKTMNRSIYRPSLMWNIFRSIYVLMLIFTVCISKVHYVGDFIKDWVIIGFVCAAM